MNRRPIFNDLGQLADTLEELAATVRRVEAAARQSAQHAEVDRLEEHLKASTVDFGAIKAVGGEALQELGGILHRLGDLVHKAVSDDEAQ